MDMLKRFSISLVVVAGLILGQVCQAQLFSKEEFEGMKRTAELILKDYPKEEYAYVGLGRSPTFLIAYLQTEEGVVAVNVPFSGTSQTLLDSSRTGNAEGQWTLKSNLLTQKLQGHFEHFLPKSRKKILVLDYCAGGSGLMAANLLFKAVLELEKSDIQVEALGIASKIGVQYIQDKNFGFKILGLEEDEPFMMALHYKAYTSLSEFDTFPIRGDLPEFKQNPSYVKLREEIQKAKADSEYEYSAHSSSEYVDAIMQQLKQHGLVLGKNHDYSVFMEKVNQVIASQTEESEHFTAVAESMRQFFGKMIKANEEAEAKTKAQTEAPAKTEL